MDNNLADFPIEPGRAVPIEGIHPTLFAKRLGANEETLTSAFKAFGHEHIGEVELRPSRTPYLAPHELAATANVTMPSLNFWESDTARLPEIVAKRFNGQRVCKVRRELHYSQAEFAQAIRNAGRRLGEPNKCTKRTVQLWEAGQVTMPSAHYQRALEAVTGLPFITLCTPVLPPDASNAMAEIAAVVDDLNGVVSRISRVVSYFSR